MITKLGEHRGVKVFRQVTADFDGIYTQPGIPVFGRTFEEAKAAIDWHLDGPPAEEDVPFDVDEAGRLSEGR